MHPLHDKDLDRLSREAAEHFEVEPGASGWANLEMRLDTELPQKKKKRRFLFWLFFITATTGGALIGILKYQPVTPIEKKATGVVSPAGEIVSAQSKGGAQNPTAANTADAVPGNSASGNYSQPQSPSAATPQPVNDDNTPVNSALNPTTAPVAVKDEPVPAASPNTNPGKNTTKTIAKTDKNNNIQSGIKKQSADKTPLTLNYATIEPGNNGNVSATLTRKPKRNPGKQQVTTAGQHKQKETVKPGIDNTQEPDAKITSGDQQAIATQPDVNNDQSTAQQAATAADPVSKEPETTAITDTAKKVEAPFVKKETDRKQDKKVKGLELGVMAGPDLSTANFGPVYKTGYNLGLQIGYRLSNRWSVNTGIIYTKKFYKADSQDFHYKMAWNYKLKNVEGNCSMWEIPVNVRYDFSYNEKRRWFASTGLSTYLMDKEYYDIYFTYNGNPNYPPYPYDSDSNSNYFFSIWHLSAGMERSLGKHFSIQAEPYLKIPLKGLGTGSMRMTSYGVLFTLKYKPFFNSKRSGAGK